MPEQARKVKSALCGMCDDEQAQDTLSPARRRPPHVRSQSHRSSCDQNCVSTGMGLLEDLGTGPGAGVAAAASAAGRTDAQIAQRKLTLAAMFCITFMILEGIGGYLAGSLAIMTDAAHLLADLAGFLISVFALWISSRPPTDSLSFGWYRMEIIGALLSVLLIWVVTGALFIEAAERIIHPNHTINGHLMLGLSVTGLFVNAAIAWILHSSGHSHGHGSGGHGHSHGGGASHGHSHGDEAAHGHSRGDGSSHGHSHGNGSSHGHSHGDGSSHGHSHGDGSSHGHSHGDGASHGHSHGNGASNSDNIPANRSKDVDSLAIPLLHSASDEHDHGHSNISGEGGGMFDHHNVNVRAAIIHAIGDLIQSLSVVVASLVVLWKPEWSIVDPLCTFLFGMIVIYTTIGLLRECLHVLMEGAPPGINADFVREDLGAVPHVVDVHDLHIWSIKHGKPSLSVHLNVDRIEHHVVVLRCAQEVLLKKFKISHSTIQVEELCSDPLELEE